MSTSPQSERQNSSDTCIVGIPGLGHMPLSVAMGNGVLSAVVCCLDVVSLKRNHLGDELFFIRSQALSFQEQSDPSP